MTINGQFSCGTRSDCIEPAIVYSRSSGTSYFIVLGWNVGCSVVDTLIRSTFECFYNQSCVDLLINYLTTLRPQMFINISATAMDLLSTSRFFPNTTVQNIVNELFIEQWHINASYAAFYRQFAPTYCLYSVQERKNALYVVSQILGLYGGLTVSLRFIVPYIAAVLFKVKRHFAVNTVQPLS